MCFVGKPLVKAKSHLDLCTPLALRVPRLGQQKQLPARIQPSLVSPLDPIPEPPQREKLTRKGSTTTKKGIFQPHLLRENQSLLPACPCSPSQLSVPLPEAAGRGEAGAGHSRRQQIRMVLPRARAACQRPLPGACCLNCLIYYIKQRLVSDTWSPSLSQSMSLSRAHSIPPRLH